MRSAGPSGGREAIMARRRKNAEDPNVQAAAYLRGVHKMTQEDIGAVLGGLKQSLVSKLLKRAEELGWLKKVDYQFVGADRLSADRLEYLERLVKPRGLLDALRQVKSRTGVRVRELRVVDSGSTRDTDRAIEARLKRMGRVAAERVRERLEGSEVFAITWGNSVSHVVNALTATPAPRRPTRPIRFVPVCAEPHDQSSNRDTSTHLVRRLHEWLQGHGANPPSLAGLPALIGRRYSRPVADAIRTFIADSASYQLVFSSPSPLINAVDTLLTSAGNAKRPMGFINEELLRAGSTDTQKLTAARLAKLVVGDVGGVLIPRPGLSDADRREVEELAGMWTGVQLAHLQRIARQANGARRPGVIVVGVGADRAEIIAEAVRWGLVNELIVDRPLAEALTRELAPRPKVA
jgi:DNA-binding transcriptional regulator LsrR (DeoR family)